MSQLTRKLAAWSVGLLPLVAFAAGCSKGSDAPLDPGAVHQVGWASRDQHAAAAKGSPGMASCTSCHGADYAGGTSGQSCFTCHAWNAPHAKEGWDGGASGHRSTSQSNAAACAACHRRQNGTPGCFNNTLCHG